MSRLYTIWKKYGEKLGLGAEPWNNNLTSLVDDKLEKMIGKFMRHLNWYVGHIAYELIKIDKKEEPKKKEDGTDEENNKKKKEKRLKEVLKMVLQSNLLSGGIEPRHLDIFSTETKQ